MALITVNVAGTKYIIECANKGTAKAWGQKKLDVVVSDASADDINEFTLAGGTIEKVAPAEKKAADPAAPAGEQAAA